MLNKLKDLPPKVILALAILLAMLVAVIVAVPVAGAVLISVLVLFWCIKTIVDHFIK